MRINTQVTAEANGSSKIQRGLGTTQTHLNLAGIEDQGVVCFTDASIKPGARPEAPEKAGIGILIKDNLQNISYTISAQIRNCSSVLMAETAGLSIASSIAAGLQLNPVHFFTDNQTLVDLLQRADLDRPPDWRIKSLTQNFYNNKSRLLASIQKIDRKLNSKAHVLAKRASSASNATEDQTAFSCSNSSHVLNCPLKAVLAALCNDCTFIAASCC